VSGLGSATRRASGVASSQAIPEGFRRQLWPPLNVNTFNPVSLFANGEKGALYAPANRSTVFTDAAGTLLAMAENAVVARINDLSPNAINSLRVSATLRPKLVFLLASYRRALDFDGVDDSMAGTFPAMGNNCTLVRASPGVGAVIQTGLTIAAGTVNTTTDHAGLILIDRALTTQETADVTLWARQRAGVEDEFNLSYGAGASEKLDVYHSSGHAQGPIIFMVHGGGWRNGDKLLSNVIKNKSQNWLPQGFTLVSVNYNLAVGTSPIDQARSVAKALAYVQARARGWRCDPSKLILIGHSAGAHLAALVASSNTIRSEAGVGTWLGTVLLDTAAYDAVEIMSDTHLPLYDEPWGSDPEVWAAGSPTLVMTSKPAPLMLVVSTEGGGEADSINGAAFKAKVESFGGRADWYETPLLHGEVNDLLGVPGTYTDAVQAFFTSLGL
jgi:Esterase/lipase